MAQRGMDVLNDELCGHEMIPSVERQRCAARGPIGGRRGVIDRCGLGFKADLRFSGSNRLRARRAATPRLVV
jgi:hypothetical protein